MLGRMKMPETRTGNYKMRVHDAKGKLVDMRIWQRDELTGKEKLIKDFKLIENREAWGGGIPKG